MNDDKNNLEDLKKELRLKAAKIAGKTTGKLFNAYVDIKLNKTKKENNKDL